MRSDADEHEPDALRRTLDRTILSPAHDVAVGPADPTDRVTSDADAAQLIQGRSQLGDGIIAGFIGAAPAQRTVIVRPDAARSIGGG
jgi:hypothetical protein